MVNVQLNWTANRNDWKGYLLHLNLSQLDIAKFLGISDQVMAILVKKMTDGQGLTANQIDKDRWKRAIEYVKYKQSHQKKMTV